jgi:prepilin-type N-terminal cleavage/methylation domain-containing protein
VPRGVTIRARRPGRNRRRGLTLIELLLAVGILAVVSSVAYFSFDAGVKAWRAGTELADSLNHADFVLEQVAMALRSAYYPDASRASGAYGFVLNDGGRTESARDTISWVKLGTALVGADAPYAGTPHRVEIGVRDAEDGSDDRSSGFFVRSWRIDAQPEDFDPAEVKPLFLTPRVVGFNCRVLKNDQEPAKELEWDDEWEDTNRIPFAVEVSLFLQPPREREEPIEVRRIVEIPLAAISWRDKGVQSPLTRRATGNTSGSSGSSSDASAGSTGSGGLRNTSGDGTGTSRDRTEPSRTRRDTGRGGSGATRDGAGSTRGGSGSRSEPSSGRRTP